MHSYSPAFKRTLTLSAEQEKIFILLSRWKRLLSTFDVAWTMRNLPSTTPNTKNMWALSDGKGGSPRKIIDVPAPQNRRNHCRGSLSKILTTGSTE